MFSVLRLGLNTDNDRIHELANHHDTIRQMLGHGGWEDKTTYKRQTIKDDGLVKSLHPHNGLKTNGIQDESA